LVYHDRAMFCCPLGIFPNLPHAQVEINSQPPRTPPPVETQQRTKQMQHRILHNQHKSKRILMTISIEVTDIF